MSVDNKKLSRSRVSSCIFKLMMSAASFSAVSTYPLIGQLYAMDEASESVERITSTKIVSIMDDVYVEQVSNNNNISFKLIKLETETGKVENFNIAHQQGAIYTLLQSIDKRGDGKILSNYELQNKFNDYQKLALEKKTTFIDEVAQDISKRFNYNCGEVECNAYKIKPGVKNKDVFINVGAMAENVFLILSYANYAIKAQSLLEIYTYQETQNADAIQKEKNKFSSELNESKLYHENALNSIEKTYSKEKSELEITRDRTKQNLVRAQTTEDKARYTKELNDCLRLINQKDIERNKNVKTETDKLNEVKNKIDAQLKIIEQNNIKKLDEINYKFGFIFQSKGRGNIPGAKTLLRGGREKLSYYAELDKILTEFPHLEENAKEKFSKALFDRYSTDDDNQNRMRALQILLAHYEILPLPPKKVVAEKVAPSQVPQKQRRKKRKEPVKTVNELNQTPVSETNTTVSTTTTTTTTSTAPVVESQVAPSVVTPTPVETSTVPVSELKVITSSVATTETSTTEPVSMTKEERIADQVMTSTAEEYSGKKKESNSTIEKSALIQEGNQQIKSETFSQESSADGDMEKHPTYASVAKSGILQPPSADSAQLINPETQELDTNKTETSQGEAPVEQKKNEDSGPDSQRSIGWNGGRGGRASHQNQSSGGSTTSKSSGRGTRQQSKAGGNKQSVPNQSSNSTNSRGQSTKK